jgi:multidrug transporter EmrE-like cation transporter
MKRPNSGQAEIPTLPHGRPCRFHSGLSLGVPALVLGNALFSMLAAVWFKRSSAANDWKGFLGWQVLGHLAGLSGVLALTFLYHLIPMRVAYPVSTGLAVVTVQAIAARLIFRETVSPIQWIGTGLIALGILLVGLCG